MGSLLFLAIAPGVVAGLLPWWLTGWDSADGLPLAVSAAGGLLVAVGAIVLLHAFARFSSWTGLGTPPAPVAPTHTWSSAALPNVRNPMYLAVAATIVGQAMILGRPRCCCTPPPSVSPSVSFVYLYEEPTLGASVGRQGIEAYRRAVRAWLPHLRRWSPNDTPWNGPGGVTNLESAAGMPSSRSTATWAPRATRAVGAALDALLAVSAGV